MAAYEKAGETDEWFTPKYIFDALKLTFDLDVAAPLGGPRHVPLIAGNAYLTIHEDGLKQPWQGLVWMNPPFGHQSTKRRWLQRFIHHRNGIALVPDRTSAPWFQEAAPAMGLVCFVSPKVKFERPDGSLGESPGTGTALFAMGWTAMAALRRSNLGLLMEPKDALT